MCGATGKPQFIVIIKIGVGSVGVGMLRNRKSFHTYKMKRGTYNTFKLNRSLGHLFLNVSMESFPKRGHLQRDLDNQEEGEEQVL